MKSIFIDFLRREFPDNHQEILTEFEHLHTLLTEANRRINLISRKIPPEEYWTIHFLDSILPHKLIKEGTGKILDLGTGGGLPGIPLKIIKPSLELHLLDSRTKKIDVLKKMIKKLDLSGCFTIVSRLEELEDHWNQYFDCIVSRSVRITPRLLKKMHELLSDNGEILLYKSHSPEDLKFLGKMEEFDISHPEIGKRKIIIIRKQENQ